MSQVTPIQPKGMNRRNPLAHATRNSLSEDVRGQVTQILVARMADAIDMVLMAKQAHWNVKGTQFRALHMQFDEVHEAARAAMDLIAERAVMLGAQVHGTIRAAAQHSSLQEYPLDISLDQDHVKALADRLSAFGKLIRDAIDATEEIGDADTADMFTEISRAIDMQTWMVESHASRT
jgi:starvation-inducible DNA-binding protein